MPGIPEIKDLMGMRCKEIGLGSSQSSLVANLDVLLALGIFQSVRTVAYVLQTSRRAYVENKLLSLRDKPPGAVV